MIQTIALFGESEKGDFEGAIHCRSLQEMYKKLGQPPKDSLALDFGVQLIQYNYQLLFFRVKEEGFSKEDYIRGLGLLKLAKPTKKEVLGAICAPGVGDKELIEALFNVCTAHHSLLITTQKDLYDYLTSYPA